MVEQRIADNPLNHPFGQSGIDHPRQGLRQRRVSDQGFDPGPQVQNGFGIDEVAEIRDRTRRFEHDVLDVVCRMLSGQINVEPSLLERRTQRRLIRVKNGITSGEKNADHRARRRWICADWTSPKATISTSIADPP